MRRAHTHFRFEASSAVCSLDLLLSVVSLSVSFLKVGPVLHVKFIFDATLSSCEQVPRSRRVESTCKELLWFHLYSIRLLHGSESLSHWSALSRADQMLTLATRSLAPEVSGRSRDCNAIRTHNWVSQWRLHFRGSLAAETTTTMTSE